MEMGVIECHKHLKRRWENGLMREKYIEQKLRNEVKKKGGVCLKLAATGLDGIPDRLVLMAKGKIGFVELKAPKQKPRKLQLVRIKNLKEMYSTVDFGFVNTKKQKWTDLIITFMS